LKALPFCSRRYSEVAAEVSVREAARELGVNQARVRQLIGKGELRAREVAGRWLVDANDVDARRARPAPATRPFSARSAWGLLLLAAGEDAPWLAPTERRRVRRRLQELPAGDWSWMCRNRATTTAWYAHPSALGRLVEDRRGVRTGISALADYDVDLTAPGQAELYARAGDLPALVRGYALEESERPNLVLRLPRDVWPFSTHEVAPPVAVAVDLLDGDDDRTTRAGWTLLERELGQVRARDSQGSGTSTSTQRARRPSARGVATSRAT
jgi:excisionase family DNA binding protein